MINRVLAVMIGVVAAACSVTPDYVPHEPPSDLLRTYVQGPVGAGSTLAISSGYGSLAEDAARAAFVEAATTQGFTVLVADDQPLDPSILRVQLSVDGPADRGQEPWRSPLQVRAPINPQARPLSNGQILTTSDFDGPPNVVITPGTRNEPIIGNLKMRIVISKATNGGQDALWTGVAYGALNGRPRIGLASAMANELARAINSEVDRRSFLFEPMAPAISITE